MSPELGFAHPWLLALLALLPLLAIQHHRRPVSGALRYSRLPAPSGGRWRLHLPFYCRLLALGFLVVALARPQLGHVWEETTTEGIDIQLVLDVSGSMAAEDFRPLNRIEVAKELLREFIASRSGDRLGLVVFAGTARTLSPLTADRRMLAELVDSIELHTLPDGTAIGMGLAHAAARLRAGEGESRVVVLVTDGINNAGEIDPVTAAALCKGLGLRVHTVAVGREGRVPLPVPVRDAEGKLVETRRMQVELGVDEALLRDIAAQTGGRFYMATDPGALQSIFEEIDRLETSPRTVRRLVRREEGFQPLAWTALALLLLPTLLMPLRVTAEP